MFVLNYNLFTVVVGEFANFIAYIYAPAVLVTPLGALSIIVRCVIENLCNLLIVMLSETVVVCGSWFDELLN